MGNGKNSIKNRIYRHYSTFNDLGDSYGVYTDVYMHKFLFLKRYKIRQFYYPKANIFCRDSFRKFLIGERFKAKSFIQKYKKDKIMEREELKKRYSEIVNEYLKQFCLKHGLNYDEAKCGWVANEVGDVVCVGDYYISFDDIRRDIDENINDDEYFKYYNYCVKVNEYGCTAPNYRSWLAGCPRFNNGQLDEIEKAHKATERAKRELERVIKEEQEKIGYTTPF